MRTRMQKEEILGHTKAMELAQYSHVRTSAHRACLAHDLRHGVVQDLTHPGHDDRTEEQALRTVGQEREGAIQTHSHGCTIAEVVLALAQRQ